ncbi:MAG: hypothetical protein Q8N44_01340, partial [Rubrivivax sp.]|nr:hypothetical protein [Rubrivivax sp.]
MLLQGVLTGKQPGTDAATLDADLGAIVGCAMAADAGQRYASVDALGADLRAFLLGLPLAARTHTPPYLLACFVRRHRAAVLAGALALGIGVSTWQARVAQRARDEARERLAQTRGLVRDIVMRYADTVTYLPGAAGEANNLRRVLLDAAQVGEALAVS